MTEHTVGGCNLQPGDLCGTGTHESRAFLHDGDTVILRGWCERAGAARIGFGECRGTVLPAVPSTEGA